jgi:CubicO group peptidase (beta-lactamase class C family)
MNPDTLKEAWRAQTAQTRLTIDTDLLLKEVRRNQKSFSAVLFWRDLREVGVSLLMVPVWFYLGAKYSLPWTWYLAVPALLWIASFMLVDRRRHKRHPPEPGEPPGRHVEDSLAQVEHQIWLLRNVLWWYLLPPGLAILAFFGQVGWLARDSGWMVALVVAGMAAVVVLLFAGLYWLNQRAIRSELEPRRRELQALLASLKEATEAGSPAVGHAGGTPETERAKWMRILGVVLLFAFTAVLSLWAYQAGKPEPARFDAGYCPAAGDPAVTNLLVPIREKHHVPAMAAAIVTSKGLVMAGVVGTRKRGMEIAATLNDQWHLGSDTKAMTATLVARLIEKGRLKWESIVAEVFPDLAAGFSSEARAITVLQLLSHRSGLKPNPDLILFGGADGTKERLRVVKDELSKAPNHKPGTHYEYSNLGYAIAGAITEKITGKSWEQAMRDEVFGPLGMTSVGFGGTGTPGQVDQPWGHYQDGQPVSGNGPAMDNPPVLSPAGRVHCTIQDWARFIADQLRGAQGERALLQPAAYKKLHTPPFEGEYALGWLAVERAWGGGKVLNHAGDNTMNFANVWVAPRRDFAVLVCVNQSGNTAFQASDEAVSALIGFHTAGTRGAEPAERRTN